MVMTEEDEIIFERYNINGYCQVRPNSGSCGDVDGGVAEETEGGVQGDDCGTD